MGHYGNTTELFNDDFTSLNTYFQNSSYKTKSNEPKPWEGHETELQILRILSGLLLLHIPVIIVTNTVVIVTYKYYSKLHTPGNLILTALCVTDFVNGLVSIPIIVINNFDFTFFRTSKELCFLRYAPILFLFDFSQFMIMVLTVDRYLALSRPFWYIRNVNNSTVLYAMFFHEVFAAIFITCYAFKFDYDKNVEDLNKRCTYKGTTPIWLNTYIPMASMIVKMSIALCCTFYVARTLWKKIKSTRRTRGSIMSKDAVEKITANGKIATILMFIYLILLIPSLAQVIQNIPYDYWDDIFYICTDHLRFANCSVNALIYAFYRKTFKKAYRYILTSWPSQWHQIGYVLREDDIVSTKRMTRKVSSEVLSSNTKKKSDNVVTHQSSTAACLPKYTVAISPQKSTAASQQRSPVTISPHNMSSDSRSTVTSQQ